MVILIGVFLILWVLWLHTSIVEIKEKLTNIEEMLKEQGK